MVYRPKHATAKAYKRDKLKFNTFDYVEDSDKAFF